MNRRELLGRAMILPAASFMAAPEVVNPHETADSPAIRGVGVLRYPEAVGSCPEEAMQRSKAIRQVAQHIAANVRQGAIIALPNNRDAHGDYEWDFRIEGGDPGQVRLVRE